MHSRSNIKDEIIRAVKEVTGISYTDENANLVDREIGIVPADFVYIFDILKKSLQLPVHNVLSEYNSDVMTVNNLANALFDLLERDSEDEILA